MRTSVLESLVVLLLVLATGRRSSDVAAAPSDDEWKQALATYQSWIHRPSLQKRTEARIHFAETRNPRARDVLIESYDKPEDPADHVRYLIVSIVTGQFRSADDLAAYAAWRKENAKPEDAWLWRRTLEAERNVSGQPLPISGLLGTAPNAVLQATVLTLLDEDDPGALPLLVEQMKRALASKDPFDRALLVEGCADALSKMSRSLGKPEFHEPAAMVIKTLDDPATLWRTKIVVARRLAETFGKPYAVLEAEYWQRLLIAAEGQTQAPADDRYAPPTPPTFGGVPATGKRIVYLIDCSDSMLAPLSVEELTELRKPPRSGPNVTPGDEPTGGEPKKDPSDDEKPPEDPMSDAAVDWKKVKTRFDAAREMLKGSLKNLAPDVSFAVVFFGSKAELAKTTPGMVPATPAAARAIAGEMTAMKPGKPTGFRKWGTLMGDTNIHGAFRKAFKLKHSGLSGPYEYVRPETFLEGCDTIFLLSDGAPSLSDWVTNDKRDPGDRAGDPESGIAMTATPTLNFHGPYSEERWILDDLQRMNLLRRVEIHVISIGEANQGFGEQVAAIGHGRVRYVAP